MYKIHKQKKSRRKRSRGKRSRGSRLKRKLTQTFEKVSSKFLELPPVYFYVGLTGFCVLLFAFSWMGEDEKQTLATKDLAIASNVLLDYDEQPLSVVDRPDLFEGLESSAGDDAKTIGKLNSIIFRLEKHICAVIADAEVSRPLWFSNEFAGAGVDRDRFQGRYSDKQIKVSRWKASSSAPVLRGDDAFEQFVKNAMHSWIDTSDFRIDLKIYETDFGEDQVTAKLVVEAFGRVEGENAQADRGIQSTAIWKTKWNKRDGELLLENIQVQAQEEIVATIPGGQLMRDCTASILRRGNTLSEQLIYGLDQWSRRIPGIDIVGNQGVAVGDINSDGLDDIYVCQPHGLPNLLLVQNPDGTADAFSKQSHLDILDESHAALMIDVDNDGDQDLIISTDESLVLLCLLYTSPSPRDRG